MHASVPIHQYDVLLAPSHPDFRTLANEVLENEVLRPLMRQHSRIMIRNISIEALQTALHEKLKVHLGDSVPSPSFWACEDTAKKLSDLPVLSTARTFAVGKIGYQKNFVVVYRVPKSCMLSETITGNDYWKYTPRVEACSDASIESAKDSIMDDLLSTYATTEIVSILVSNGLQWAGNDAYKKICFSGFEEDIRKIQEWQITMGLFYPKRESHPLHHAKHEAQHARRCVRWMAECYEDMLERGAGDVPQQISVPTISDQDHDDLSKHSTAPLSLLHQDELPCSEEDSDGSSLNRITSSTSSIQNSRSKVHSTDSFDPEMKFLLGSDSNCFGNPSGQLEASAEKNHDVLIEPETKSVAKCTIDFFQYKNHMCKSADPPARYDIDKDRLVNNRNSIPPSKSPSFDNTSFDNTSSASHSSDSSSLSVVSTASRTTEGSFNIGRECPDNVSEKKSIVPLPHTVEGDEGEFILPYRSYSNKPSKTINQSDHTVVRKAHSMKALYSAPTTSESPNTVVPGTKTMAHWMTLESRFKK